MGLWGAALWFYQSQPELFPEAVQGHVAKCSNGALSVMSKAQDVLKAQGFELQWSAQTKVLILAGVSFLLLWIALSILLGLKGFFKDFFSFFPLSK